MRSRNNAFEKLRVGCKIGPITIVGCNTTKSIPFSPAYFQAASSARIFDKTYHCYSNQNLILIGMNCLIICTQVRDMTEDMHIKIKTFTKETQTHLCFLCIFFVWKPSLIYYFFGTYRISFKHNWSCWGCYNYPFHGSCFCTWSKNIQCPFHRRIH